MEAVIPHVQSPPQKQWFVIGDEVASYAEVLAPGWGNTLRDGTDSRRGCGGRCGWVYQL